MSFFPIYIIKPFTCENEAEKKALITSGKTHIIGVILASDYGVTIANEGGRQVVHADILSAYIMDRLVEAYGGELWLFAQFRHEVFWFKAIKKENIRPSPQIFKPVAGTAVRGDGYIRITLPIEQTVISALG